MTSSTTPATIRTLGYTGSTPDDLRQYAEHLGATIVDVRLKANSMRPEWRGACLGNVNYKSVDRPIQIADLPTGLAALQRHAQARPLILLCSCPDHRACHRLVVAQAFAAQIGAVIEHLPARFASWRGGAPAPQGRLL